MGWKRPPDVRFGSKADSCSAATHVRFTPNSDRESRHPQPVIGHVYFTPESGRVQCTSACPLWANSGHSSTLPFEARAPQFHSMIMVVSASTLGGIIKPSAFAVFRLIAKLNLVDTSTGSSAGFSPLRMRPV